ncbi:MAG: hypothetical protein ACRES9_12360 [Gammaproteobacteria bacterium]
MLTPALVWAELEVEAAVAGKRLARRWKRAVKRSVTAPDSLALTAEALGIEAPPSGALARIADGLSPADHNWFRAAPVMLTPDRDQLVLQPLDQPLSTDDADALAGAARTHFGGSLALERGRSGRWYAAFEDVCDVAGVPPDEMTGRPLGIVSFGGGPDASRLRAFLTELQMLWYEHPVNLARREAGLREANALWLWGGGALPEKPVLDEPARLHADSPELIGLASWLGLEFAPLDEPAPGEPRSRDLTVIDGEAGALGETWLGAFAALRGEFRLYTKGSEWRIPPRRGLFRLRG